MSNYFPNNVSSDIAGTSGNIRLPMHEISSLKNDDLPKAHTTSRTFTRNIGSEGITREQIIHDPDQKSRYLDLKQSIRNPLFHDFSYVERRLKSQPHQLSVSQPFYSVQNTPSAQNVQGTQQQFQSNQQSQKPQRDILDNIGGLSQSRNSLSNNLYEVTQRYDDGRGNLKSNLTYKVPPEKKHNMVNQYPYPVQSSPKVVSSHDKSDYVNAKLRQMMPTSDIYAQLQAKSTAQRYFGSSSSALLAENQSNKYQVQQNLPQVLVNDKPQDFSSQNTHKQNNLETKIQNHNLATEPRTNVPEGNPYTENNNNIQRQSYSQQQKLFTNFDNNNNYNIPTQNDVNYPNTLHRQSKSQQVNSQPFFRQPQNQAPQYVPDTQNYSSNPSHQQYLQDFYSNVQVPQNQYPQSQQYSDSQQPPSYGKRTWKPLNPITQKRHYQYEPKYDLPSWKWDQYDRDQFGKWNDNRDSYNNIIRQKNIKQKRKEGLPTTYKEYGI